MDNSPDIVLPVGDGVIKLTHVAQDDIGCAGPAALKRRRAATIASIGLLKRRRAATTASMAHGCYEGDHLR